MPLVRRGSRTDLLPTMRASDARIQDAKAPLQGSNLLGLLVEEDFGSVGAFSEGECLRMSSASSFYQKKHHQSTTLCTTAKKRPIAPARVRRRREKMQITWLPTSPIHFQWSSLVGKRLSEIN